MRALALCAVLVGLHSQLATAQADDHARAVARTSCQAGKQTERVTDATAALARDPDELAPRMRLADALIDQGCYQEAVTVLEAGQQGHPRSNELAAKLRDVRSLVTEQTYIEGLTQAAEGAKFQRNQLRCTQLADVTACEDALKFKPDDPQLVAAKHDALAKRAALAATESPQVDTVTSAPLAAAAAPRAKTKRPPATVSLKPNATPAAAPGAASAPAATSTEAATLASLTPTDTKTYSNDAPPGHSN